MDKELQEYYESLLDLFVHKGWDIYQEDLKRSLDNLSDIRNTSDANMFWFRKGQVEVLETLLGYRNAIEASYAELTDDKSL
jgi:uncharacterized protein YutE (UPF0331/DUF86 family)